jgi:hypothetical protein
MHHESIRSQAWKWAYLSVRVVELVNDEFAHSSSDRAGSTTVD